MKRIFLVVFIIFMLVSSVYAEGGVPEYNLSRMKQMNPDFTTYPDAQGIIWLKHVDFSRSDDGGMNVTRLFVILGRRGLGGKWLNWNIPIPEKGSVEVLDASVYDFETLSKISSASQTEDISAGIKNVNFMGLPDNFILALAWREVLPDSLSIDGLCWFQEELRVWESILEIQSPQPLSYKTFPLSESPHTENLNDHTVYTWRKINTEPYKLSGELARSQREGIVFSTRSGYSGLTAMIKNVENSGGISAPGNLTSGFKRSKDDSTLKMLEWLRTQPEIILTEGSPRKIPSNAPWTRREKLLLAKSWLTSQKIAADLYWVFPFEPNEETPLCAEMFFEPVLEVNGIKGVNFHDMNDPKLLSGVKIFALADNGRFRTMRVPSASANDNRLSAIMDLKLSDNGALDGNVRLILRGAWGAFLLGSEPSEGTVRGAILSLFPGLKEFKEARYKITKGTPEILFKIENKPGVGGTGKGLLAILPFFYPDAVRRLPDFEAPIEILFPFVMDQNITLGFPKNAKEALVSGKTNKNPDKINYSESYQNRRHRLIAESRFELNMSSVSEGNMSLLQKNLNQWRIFSAKHIPVR